jgi:hypothetical protein
MKRLGLLLVSMWSSCATAPAVSPTPQVKATPVAAEGSVVPFGPATKAVEESHFGALTQLTFGGENAEAYWRFDGTGVSLQRRAGEQQCDRIYTLPLLDHGVLATAAHFSQFSSGEGATTCAHFLAGDDEILYASTHLGGLTCPPKPDMK